jgi:hypothetical protein
VGSIIFHVPIVDTYFLFSLGRSSGNGTFGIQTIKLKGIDFDDNFKPAGAEGNVSPQPAVHVGAGEHWYCMSPLKDSLNRPSLLRRCQQGC